jgi:hypothetical protein
MAELNDLFEIFISNINPDETAVQYAIDAHKPVRKCLEEQDDFKEYVEGSFLYGSYKRYTAVGDIKDVDIVVLTNFDTEDEKNTPQKVLRSLKDALARCYEDPENPQYQRRSIRIDDPLPEHEDVEMTLDIIPAVIVTDRDGPLYVPDRVVKEWIWSHPKGHLRYTSKLNAQEYSKNRFVPLVKMMKWWWKYQCEIIQPEVERPKPKGFWIECLTAEHFDRHQTAWADHFIAVLKSVSEAYTEAETVPELQDPGLEDETIKTSMTTKEFAVFMDAVGESLEKAVLARDASDPLTSSELWQELFGDKFPLYDAEETEETRSQAKSIALGSDTHAKKSPWPIELNKKYKVQLRAYLHRDGRKLGGLGSDGRVVRSGYYIKFVARTPARGNYEVHWQVVNTGKHAEREGGLRGEFFSAKFRGGTPSTDPLINWEWTQYTGKHWIECFIVKDGVCVGRSGRFYVNIKNPDY